MPIQLFRTYKNPSPLKVTRDDGFFRHYNAFDEAE
jgi:hypothetical protein